MADGPKYVVKIVDVPRHIWKADRVVERFPAFLEDEDIAGYVLCGVSPCGPDTAPLMLVYRRDDTTRQMASFGERLADRLRSGGSHIAREARTIINESKE